MTLTRLQMELHYTNRILPPSVVSHVQSDDEANWRDIEATMVNISSSPSFSQISLHAIFLNIYMH